MTRKYFSGQGRVTPILPMSPEATGWRRAGRPDGPGRLQASLRGCNAERRRSAGLLGDRTPELQATATVLGCQAHGTSSVRHGVRCLSIAFRMINSFRMHAVRATFLAFPVAHKR